MPNGFRTVLVAQFLSALADNALLFAAIALLAQGGAPDWQVPVLQQCFVLAYIALAPFVGTFADALPKGRVMFLSNAVKIAGCALMLFGTHPLAAFAIVGLGAAMYSPAKYGILTELLPSSRLVEANGWMEGLTVAAIVLGAIAGGILISAPLMAPWVAWLADAGVPGIDGAPRLAIAVLLLVYALASLVNLRIPVMAVRASPRHRDPIGLVRDFARCLVMLWRDPLGQVSLAVTTLFWGAGATLRLIVLAWAGIALGLSLEQATQLTAVVALGIAAGAAIAGRAVALERSVRVLPVGIAMGLAVALMSIVSEVAVALPLIALIGAMGGYFVVPMNALLQHRGHRLMGAGHSIAVQNFNENLSILAMLGLYALMLRAGLGVPVIAVVFGLGVAAAMTLLWQRHRHDQD